MPSVSKAQKRTMAAAAHTPGGYAGIPQSVGKEFNAADQARGKVRLPARKKARVNAKVPGRKPPAGLINRA